MGQDESKSAGEGATVRGNELGAQVLVGGERVSFFGISLRALYMWRTENAFGESM